MDQTTQAELKKAGLAFQQGDYQRAAKAARNVLHSLPKSSDALYILALSHARLGNIKDAEAAFNLSVAVHNKPEEVLHNQAAMYRTALILDKAEEYYRAALSRNPQYIASKLSLAAMMANQDRNEEAINQYEDILKFAPHESKAMTGLGAMYNKLGKYDLAQEFLENSLQIKPQSAFALNNLSTTFLKRGDLNNYAEFAAQAYQASPQNQDIAANLARAYERIGKIDQANELYGRALALNPGNIDTHRDYSRFLWSSGNQADYLRAIDQSLDLYGTDVAPSDLLLLKGQLAYRAGHLGVSEEAYDRILAVNNVAEARSGRASVYADTGRLNSADSDYREAVKLAPDTGEIRHEYATFLLGHHDYDHASNILNWHPPKEHVQRQVALEATLARLVGSDRYRELYDYDRFTRKQFIEAPTEYGSRTMFLEAVEHELQHLFDTTQQPIDQTLFGGVQTKGDLWETQSKVLLQLRDALFQVACRFVSSLEKDESHTFLKYVPDMRSTFLEFTGSWAVRLKSGGGHVDHIHPAGWLSSAHYVTVPDNISGGGGTDKSGWLRLGAPPIKGVDLSPEHYIRPEPGALILFPSYIWHGVEPFESDQPRITTPFDLRSTAE